jgi:hypothetical protein
LTAHRSPATRSPRNRQNTPAKLPDSQLLLPSAVDEKVVVRRQPVPNTVEPGNRSYRTSRADFFSAGAGELVPEKWTSRSLVVSLRAGV